MSLLAKAKAVPVKTKASADPEVAELAVAWLLGEVSTAQASTAMGYVGNNTSSVYVKLAGGLKGAVEMGLITVERKP